MLVLCYTALCLCWLWVTVCVCVCVSAICPVLSWKPGRLIPRGHSCTYSVCVCVCTNVLCVCVYIIDHCSPCCLLCALALGVIDKLLPWHSSLQVVVGWTAFCSSPILKHVTKTVHVSSQGVCCGSVGKRVSYYAKRWRFDSRRCLSMCHWTEGSKKLWENKGVSDYCIHMTHWLIIGVNAGTTLYHHPFRTRLGYFNDEINKKEFLPGS